MNKRHTAFDFDGTVLDTNEVIVNSWQEVFRHFEGKERTEAEIFATFGETVDFSMRRFFPDDKVEEAKKVYRAYQAEHAEEQVRLFDGVRELLSELKVRGHLVSLVTSRLSRTTHDYLEMFGIADLFDVVITCDDVAEHKPDPKPLLVAMERLGVTAEETLMLGDTKFDIGCANNAGADSVLAKWSHAISEEDVRDFPPKYVIDKPEDFLELV